MASTQLAAMNMIRDYAIYTWYKCLAMATLPTDTVFTNPKSLIMATSRYTM